MSKISVLAAVMLACASVPASAETMSGPTDVDRYKPKGPICTQAPCGPKGPICLGKRCGPGPIKPLPV